MAVSVPSLRPKILTGDKLRPGRRHTLRMADLGCHLAACSLYVLLVIIGIFFLTCAITAFARIVLYKVSSAILSRPLSQKSFSHSRNRFESSHRKVVAQPEIIRSRLPRNRLRPNRRVLGRATGIYIHSRQRPHRLRAFAERNHSLNSLAKRAF
jgi:hypothetical protein